jgi:hypothetical protein
MPSFLAGQKLTAALLNQVGSYGTFWANPPEFRMHQSVAQNVPNATWTQITCDASDYDSDSGRAGSSPYSFVIPTGMSGRWSFGWILPWVSNGTGSRAGVLYKNGVVASTYPILPAAGATSTNDGSADRIACNAGDVMALYGWQSSGGTLATYVASDSMATFWGKLDSLGNP